MKSRLLLLGVLLGLLAGPACTRSGADRPALSAADKTYPLKGEIMAVDARRDVLVVQHEAVAGLMPAMTMEFAVSPGDAANARVGQHFRADLLPSARGNYRLINLWPDGDATAAEVRSGAVALHRDTEARGQAVYREVGENLPDFVLYDQSGRVVRSARFRGKQIMLNFIYTSCPVADMCPAATLKMMATQRLAKAAGVPNLELVSITLDPERDTPGVLHDYAAARGIDLGNFSFLTGPEAAIRDLLTQFGVIAVFDGPIARHTLTTLLIDEHGRIVDRADGSVWEPRDFVAKMHRG
ncbi:MAG: SCO family protein [Opitutales bacterium]